MEYRLIALGLMRPPSEKEPLLEIEQLEQLDSFSVESLFLTLPSFAKVFIFFDLDIQMNTHMLYRCRYE
jgi:hypothetical protein